MKQNFLGKTERVAEKESDVRKPRRKNLLGSHDRKKKKKKKNKKTTKNKNTLVNSMLENKKILLLLCPSKTLLPCS
jgi:hypothetical protein